MLEINLLPLTGQHQTNPAMYRPCWHAAAGGAIHPVAAVPYAYLHHGLVAHPIGAVVPVEPADVVAARQAHLAAHASA